MPLIPAAFGLIAAGSGLVALVARFQSEPFYSVFVRFLPPLRRLQAAREALTEERSIKIADKQDILETIHQVTAAEYDSVDERYTPVEFDWLYQGFRFRYAEQRTQTKKNSPDIQDEMINHLDERISERLGRIAIIGTSVALLGFALSVITALI